MKIGKILTGSEKFHKWLEIVEGRTVCHRFLQLGSLYQNKCPKMKLSQYLNAGKCVMKVLKYALPVFVYYPILRGYEDYI